MPMGTLRPMGSQPSHTPNTISSSSASQKAGVLAISMDQPLISLSGQRPWNAPASTPMQNPKRPENTHASTSSHTEPASFEPITSSTGRRYKSEVPKSPCSIPFAQAKKRSKGGVSAPQ